VARNPAGPLVIEAPPERRDGHGDSR
jgi:hypothetical protein